jgi:hypothetical protein
MAVIGRFVQALRRDAHRNTNCQLQQLTTTRHFLTLAAYHTNDFGEIHSIVGA